MFALIQSGVVVAVNKAGFSNAVISDGTEIAEGEDLNVGMTYEKGLFFMPIVELPISDHIEELESSITPRNLRMAALGDEFAINKLQSVEDVIQKLRSET